VEEEIEIKFQLSDWISQLHHQTIFQLVYC